MDFELSFCTSQNLHSLVWSSNMLSMLFETHVYFGYVMSEFYHCILISIIFWCYREIPKFSYVLRILWFWVSEGLMGCPRSNLEKGIVENGDVKKPLLHDGEKNNKFKRWRFKIRKDFDAQGSAATAIFCTSIVTLGPL